MISRIRNYYRRNFWSAERYARSIGVKIGEQCDIQNVSFGSEPYLIEIGNNVQITNGVKFFTHGAAWIYRGEDPTFDVFGKIKIGDNVYIGNSALLMPGVSVGDNVIIAAGSVVTKSVGSGLIVGGNPARIVGEVSDFIENIKEYNVGTKGLNYQEKRTFLENMIEENFIKK